MTTKMLCGTALAVLMLSSVPALALYDPDNPDCGGEVCITGAEDGSAEVVRPESGKGGPMIRNRGEAADPTAHAQDRRSDRARPATVNGGSGGEDPGDQCDPSVPDCDGVGEE